MEYVLPDENKQAKVLITNDTVLSTNKNMHLLLSSRQKLALNCRPNIDLQGY